MTTTTLLARRRGDRGSMAVEVVLLTPVLLMFTLLVVAGGRYVSVRGDIEAAARDAARAASYERSVSAAQTAAQDAARASLDNGTDCLVPPPVVDTGSEPMIVTVSLDCSVSYDGLGLIGLSGTLPVNAESKAPLDTYRRFGE